MLSRAEATTVVRDAQASGEVVVLCHGCFDIVHPGHIRHLKEAARHGDRLVVSITGDAGVDKGDGRPLIPQELRAENVAALDCVRHVVINPEPTAVGLLTDVRPDVYVKGREYEQREDARCLAEIGVVQGSGGRVVFTSGEVVFSSTALISAMEETAAPFPGRFRRLMEPHDLTPASAEPVLGNLRGRRMLVVGETIVDTYVMCDRPHVADESPVMTLRPLEYRSFDGGAAIIARHLAAMGARPVLVTALPRSPRGEALRRRLGAEGVEVRALEMPEALPEKQRFLVGTSKVMKLDLGESLTLDAAQQQRLLDLTRGAAVGCDAAIVADYGHGLFTAALLQDLCRTLRKRVELLVGDVSGRRARLLSMTDLDLVCPSEAELRDALNNYDAGLTNVVWTLLSRTRSRSAMITLGEEGLIVFERTDDDDVKAGEAWRHRLHAVPVPSFTPYALDPLGCGDALLAATTLARAAGAAPTLAAVLGTVAASAQARRLGNTVINAADLRRGIARLWQAQLALDEEATPGAVIQTLDQLRPAHA